jgi:hypothetical protein
MGVRARFTIASVVSLAAAGAPLLVLGACGDGTSQDKTYPLESSVPPPRDAQSTKDTTPPEEEASVDAGTCPTLGAPIEVQHVEEDPNNEPIGGVIPDGTYVLSSAVFADGAPDGGVAFKRAALMTFSGKNVVWQFDTDDVGKPDPKCCIGTWAYNATVVMSLNMTCNGKFEPLDEYYDFYATGIPDAGADAGAGKPQIMIHVGALHDVYTKQ